MSFLDRLDRLFQRIENRPYHPERVVFIVLLVGFARGAEEIYLGHTHPSLSGLSQIIAFYFPIFLGFSCLTAIFTAKPWEKAVQVIFYGLFAGILPPLIDVLVSGLGKFRYSYLDFFEPFLHVAGSGIGEAITVWAAILSFVIYVFIRTRSVARSLLGSVTAYGFLVCIGHYLPNLGRLISRVESANLSVNTIRGLLLLSLAFLIYMGLNGKRFFPSLKRVNHTLPWVILVFLGAEIAGTIQAMTWIFAVLVLFIHQGIIFANDYYDRDSDLINERRCSLGREDIYIVHAFIIWMALTIFFEAWHIGIIYLLYIIFTWAYHHPATRFKDSFPYNHLTEGIVAALAILIGIASVSGTELTVNHLFYLMITFSGFTLGTFFKDYKDIRGDRFVSTRTIYIILEEKGVSPEKTHRYVSYLTIFLLLLPLVFLPFFHGQRFYLILLAFVFAVLIFFSLKHENRVTAVERTVWLLNGYLLSLVLVLALLSQQTHSLDQYRYQYVGHSIADFGKMRKSVENFYTVSPSSTEEIVEVFRIANTQKLRLRIHAAGHSMNLSSLPYAGEIVVLTDKLRQYRFEEKGTVTVGTGIGVYELREFLKQRGYDLPVYNDGADAKSGPTIGGFIAAGGIGRGSRDYGGFWENALEITLVTGSGEKIVSRAGNELFPWLFGSMGQLGIFTEVKLKILLHGGQSYPEGEKGIIKLRDNGLRKQLEPQGRIALYWFTLFVPPEELDNARFQLNKLMMAHKTTLKYIPIYVYPFKFYHFNPPLLYPFEGDFIGVGIWGTVSDSHRHDALLALEQDFMRLAKDHPHEKYRRYIQTEIVPPDVNYREYFGDEIYEKFLALKKELDPNMLLGCDTVFPCPP